MTFVTNWDSIVVGAVTSVTFTHFKLLNAADGPFFLKINLAFYPITVYLFYFAGVIFLEYFRMIKGECGGPAPSTVEFLLLKIVVLELSAFYLVWLHYLPKTWVVAGLAVMHQNLHPVREFRKLSPTGFCSIFPSKHL